MGLATTTSSYYKTHHNSDSSSMSQDYHHHQGIFSFSNGFHRSSSTTHQEEVDESAVSGAPIPVYETAGMLSEMFAFPGGGGGGGSGGEILDQSTKQLLEQQNRHDNNNNSTLHMLLPNHHQGFAFTDENTMQHQQQQHHFTWPISSSDHHHNHSQGDIIGTVHVEGGKGLSLSLSSSLAAAKAEEYRSIYCAAVDGTSSSSNASAHHHQFNQFKNLLLDNSSSSHHHHHHHQVVGHFGSSSSSSPMAASSSIGGIYTLRNSKYTKPAQELLEEFCSVGRGQFKKNQLSRNNSNPNTSGGGGGGSSSSAGAANDNPPLSPADRIEHQRRKVKLLSMLEEVDRRYNHYCEQMQMVVNSFDQVMGYGAAVPYTTLAQKAMSRHFRCLKDAVAVQLKRSCELLGDKEAAGAASSGLTKGETPRLRLLEQSLRQQRAFHHMGMMEQEAWRPQRGLPERSVNILRAWLFEHFLNPCMQLRSHKATKLVALSNKELGRLERSKGKATQSAEMNPQGILPEGANPPVFPAAEGGNNPPNLPPAAVGPIGLHLGPVDPYAHRPVDPRAAGPIDPHPGPVDPLAAAQYTRTLGEQDTPDRFYANRSALRPPNPTRQDYEIKYSLINLVQNRCFNGLPTENPMDHIEAFEALCRTTKANGVPYDYLRLTLFEFSLGGKAQRWLKMLEPGSITTWEACRAKFLNHFYTKARSARMRNQIVAFKQKSTETFNEAWERFKEYVKDCPHHGYTQESLMTTFYGGIDTQYQMALDTASKGDFSTNTVAQATALIENLARSNSDHAPEYDRSVKVKAVETDALKDLTQKVNLLLAREQQPVQVCGGEEDEDSEELNYVGGYRGGFNPNYWSHPNLSYRSNNVENPQDMVYPPRQQAKPFTNYPPKPAAPEENKLEMMMHTLIESHKKSATEINAKIDGMYGDLNGKFTALTTRVDSLDKRVSSMASSSKGKEACNAVMTHSGVNASFKTSAYGDLSDFQKPGLTDLLPRSTDPLAGFTLLTREVRSTDPPQDRPIRAADSAFSSSFPNEGDTHFIAKADVPLYKPQSPYPSMPKAKIDEKKYKRFKNIIGELIKEATLSEVLGDLPFLKKICRDVIAGVEDAAEVDAYLAKRMEAANPKLVKMEKLEDPGKFVVPCSIDGEVFANSLCDSGSSVNVMSMATVRRLDLQGMETSRCSLKFANASTTTPQGFLGDVEVRIGNHLVPTDFHVVEMSGGSETPLILGRAFLTTVGAVFDLEEPKMTFAKIDKDVAYYPEIETKRLGAHLADACMVRMKRTPRMRVIRPWPFSSTEAAKRKCNCNPPCIEPMENQDGIRDEIHPHDLNMFVMRVKMIPKEITFNEAWNRYVGLRTCFRRSMEPPYVIEAHFHRARENAETRRCLPKFRDPGCFVIPCAINGTSVYNCLCDSGAGTSVIPTAIASRCGITNCYPSTSNLYMADESIVVPRGELRNEMVRIGDVDVPTDFKVVDVPGKRQQVIFGRAFLNTVGAVIDSPNRRVCFTNIDREVFYHVTPRENAVRPIRIQQEERSVRISGELGPITRSQTQA